LPLSVALPEIDPVPFGLGSGVCVAIVPNVQITMAGIRIIERKN
jgi:hypothetical protein